MNVFKRVRLLAVVVIVGAALGGAAAEADEGSQAFGFQGFTAASSLRLSYEIPGYIAPRPIDGAGPIAEATLDALAGGGFASPSLSPVRGVGQPGPWGRGPPREAPRAPPLSRAHGHSAGRPLGG